MDPRTTTIAAAVDALAAAAAGAPPGVSGLPFLPAKLRATALSVLAGRGGSGGAGHDTRWQAVRKRACGCGMAGRGGRGRAPPHLETLGRALPKNEKKKMGEKLPPATPVSLTRSTLSNPSQEADAAVQTLASTSAPDPAAFRAMAADLRAAG